MSADKSPATRANRLCALSFALLCSAMAGCAAAAERPFSFGEALQYMNSDDALASAKTFVATQLPAGTSRADAVARLARADMDCERSKTPDSLNCVAWGSLADKWTAHVTLDDHGAVSTASVDYERIGVDPN